MSSEAEASSGAGVFDPYNLLPGAVRARITFANGGCWEWTGSRTAGGYGNIKWNGKNAYVHRFVFQYLGGSIPSGWEIDHLCRNRACCNPSHLEPVTPAENRRRQADAITHCPAGHEYTEDNPRGNCRVCINERKRRYWAENGDRISAQRRATYDPAKARATYNPAKRRERYLRKKAREKGAA